MFLRSLSSTNRHNSHLDIIVEQRALQLTRTFSVDWNGNFDELRPSQTVPLNFNPPSVQNNSRHNLNPQDENLSRNHILSSQEDLNQEGQSQINSVNQDYSFHSLRNQWLSHTNNVLIISRANHLNQDDFYQAIDFLFQGLNQPKVKPKFRHLINRLKTKCSAYVFKQNAGQVVCNTECRHKFHKDCLQKWTQRNPSCPLCRIKFK